MTIFYKRISQLNSCFLCKVWYNTFFNIHVIITSVNIAQFTLIYTDGEIPVKIRSGCLAKQDYINIVSDITQQLNYSIQEVFMKEQIYTIPLTDAFRSGDECPFCYIERNLEQYAIDFALGSGASYMEDDIRAQTDELGFCRSHFEKMYNYGNRLGAGLILSTHIKKKNQEITELMKNHTPGKSSVLNRLKKTSVSVEKKTAIGQWVQEQERHCYICDYIRDTYTRYLDTFFEMYRKSPEFRELFANSRGFCLHHFADLVETAETQFSSKEKNSFYEVLFPLMEKNLNRVQGDIEWFCDKFDYRNKDADWKDSRDALQRSMQKMAGGHPADPPYVQDK